MFEVKGQFSEAVVFADVLEEEAINQIRELCNQEMFAGRKIRIMPDAHQGMGCVIGFTVNITDKIVPNLVGVDIGCGMLTVELGRTNIDFESLDYYIRKHIPYGFAKHKRFSFERELSEEFKIKLGQVSKKTKTSYNTHINSIGTLGGGNHFIEVNVDNNNNKFLVIHSGSRNLGLQVANYHQKKAIKKCKDLSVPKALAYLEGKEKDEYISDMEFAQNFAAINRRYMSRSILEGALNIEFNEVGNFTTTHNYYSSKDGILRKGAVSANAGEKIVIPINMRDGSIIAVGKGNENWNNSAPHGAGRLMSRKCAKSKLSLDNLKKQMQNVWTSSLKQSTLDEAPDAYKSIDFILNHITDTVQVISVIKPLYNFKAN
ncbi:MAG: RNA-splicing ligase RtcB [Alkaliphilus sp.]|nr:RtcB family protein [bacterium AH-315-L21]MBN4056623.1 RtcB family protein [bacterium AH-315-K05]MBN4069891.1 RtcB family protein [bacterium AH-315-G05]PHS34781.1 MAG: RNA-splicing ligase RtcB [Alkaliphilus sp.]